MSNISIKQKFFAIAGGGLVGFLIILFLVISPLLSDITEQHLRVQEQKDRLNLLIMEEASYNTARADLEKIEPRVQEIEGLFPVKERLVGFVERLEEIAQNFESDFAITITDVAEQQVVSRSRTTKEQEVYEVVPGLKKVEVIPFDFQLSGSFSGIVKFLQTLENQPFYSEIESMTLTSVLEKSGSGSSTKEVRSGRVEANIRAAFYAKQQKK